jgi:lipoprotein-anchoring transpeptidase ErfK/SrfK
MEKLLVASASAVAALFLVSAAPSPEPASLPVPFAYSPLKLTAAARVATGFTDFSGPRSLRPPEPLAPPPPPTAKQALRNGVLIVVSLASQRAFVFRKGEPWDSTQVSTGRAGKETPKGVFPILEKQVMHRSTLYDDAPMPFMQRLTWGGVALHAGHVTGRPASHGCIRLPGDFARKLYDITNFSSTVVVVTDREVSSARDARKLA